MRTIAVTGVSGFVGQRLLRILDRDPDVRRVVGIDARDPRFRPAKLAFHRVDLASADLKPLLDGADVLVHLAWSVEPAHDTDLLARVNVDATRRLLDAAGSVGIRHLVFTSSAMVYGAWSDNPVPLTEDALVRPNPGFSYAAQKAEAERLVGDWKVDHPGSTATVLRPAAVPAAAGSGWLMRVWRGPLLRVRGAPPPVQFVHEDDLAEAVAVGARDRLDGVFNVAPDGWIAGEDARALASSLRVSLPERLVRSIVEVGWRTGMSDVTPAVLPYTCHPWVIGNDRLRASGWSPSHSNEEAFVASAELPPWRAYLARHRQEVALVATAAVIVAAVSGAVAIVRRRRRRG